MYEKSSSNIILASTFWISVWPYMTCNPTIEIMFSGRLFDYFAIFLKMAMKPCLIIYRRTYPYSSNFRWSIIELLFSMQNSKKYEESIDFV